MVVGSLGLEAPGDLRLATLNLRLQPRGSRLKALSVQGSRLKVIQGLRLKASQFKVQGRGSK